MCSRVIEQNIDIPISLPFHWFEMWEPKYNKNEHLNIGSTSTAYNNENYAYIQISSQFFFQFNYYILSFSLLSNTWKASFCKTVVPNGLRIFYSILSDSQLRIKYRNVQHQKILFFLPFILYEVREYMYIYKKPDRILYSEHHISWRKSHFSVVVQPAAITFGWFLVWIFIFAVDSYIQCMWLHHTLGILFFLMFIAYGVYGGVCISIQNFTPKSVKNDSFAAIDPNHPITWHISNSSTI